MAIELKCPFCNGELVGTIGHPICRNQDCVMCDDPMPQDLLEELICTRKALDVAVDALKELRPAEKKSCYLVPTASTTQRIIDEALEQITALTKGGGNE